MIDKSMNSELVKVQVLQADGRGSGRMTSIHQFTDIELAKHSVGSVFLCYYILKEHYKLIT